VSKLFRRGYPGQSSRQPSLSRFYASQDVKPANRRLTVEELAFDLKRKPFEICATITRLIAAGAIIKLVSKRDGGPFYASTGCVESSEKRDHSDQRLYRNYGGQIYDSPAWTDDV
jgi:hypothetical protein